MKGLFDLSILNRNMKLIISSRALSRAGDVMEQLAFCYLAYSILNQATTIGIIFFFSGLGNFIVLPFIGYIVDRYQTKKLMVIAELTRFTVIFILALSTLFSYKSVTLLIIIALISSIGESIYESCVGIVVKESVVEGNYDLYSSLSSFINTILRLGTTVVSGYMISYNLLSHIFFFDAFTFLVSALCAYLLNVEHKVIANSPIKKLTGKLITDYKEGLKYLFNHKELILLILLSIIISIALTPISMFLPVITNNFLNVGALGGGILNFAQQLGIILTLILYKKFIRERFKVHKLNSYLLVLLSFTMLTFICFKNLGTAFVLFFIVGSSMILFDIVNSSKRMEIVEKRFVGKICAINMMIMYGISPLCSIIFGYLIEISGIKIVMIYCSIIMILLSIVVTYIFNKYSKIEKISV